MNNVKLVRPDEEVLDEIARQIAEHFNIKELGHTRHYLDIKMKYDRKSQRIQLSQRIYIK